MKIPFLHTTLWILLLTSCGPSAKKSDQVQAENEQLVRSLYEHFNRHDWQAMAELYTDTAEFKDPAFGPGVVKQTRQQIIEKYTELGTMFPDVRDEVLNVYPSGTRHVIVEFVSTGSADTTKFELPICTVFTIENNKISRDYTYYDNF